MVNASEKIQKVRFEELFREYFSSLCYFAQKYTVDLDSAREIVHSVFVAIWEKRESFDFGQPAKSYLFTAVYNRSLNFLRDKKKFTDTDDTDFLLERGEADPDYMAEAELEGRIWKVIDRLPEKCREIFIMNRFDGKKYAEIASMLNISVKTVETQMTKALKALRSELADYLLVLWILILKNFW